MEKTFKRDYALYATGAGGNFFDKAVYGLLLPEEDEILAIRDRVDLCRVEEETADLYDDSGRPAYPASVPLRMLLLKCYANLSDMQAACQCRYNLLYRDFVGLGVGELTPDDTTLVVFWRRLGGSGSGACLTVWWPSAGSEGSWRED